MNHPAPWLSALKAILLAGLLLQSISIGNTQTSPSPAAVPAQQTVKPLLNRLKKIQQLLQQQHWQQLPAAWLHTEQAWQQLYTPRTPLLMQLSATQLSASRLFAPDSPGGLSAVQRQQQLNKVYNRLQLAYLLFQQQPDVHSFQQALQQAQQDLLHLDID